MTLGFATFKVPCFQANLRLSSPKSQEDISSALRAVTDPKPKYTLFDPDLGDFRGQISDNSFRVRWQAYGMWNGQTITPMIFTIEGRICPAEDGCIIDLAVRRNLALFWFPLVVLVFSIFLMVSETGKIPPNYGGYALMTTIAFAITWLLGVIDFRFGLGDLKRRLNELWLSRTID